LEDECFVLCNEAPVATVFGLGLKEANGFGEAQLKYIRAHLEEDLLMAASNTISAAYDHAATVTSRTAVQARSWRTVAKADIEDSIKSLEKRIKGRVVRVGPSPGIKRKSADRITAQNDRRLSKIKIAVIKLYDQENNVDPYRKSAIAQEIGISPKTLSYWLKRLSYDFDDLITRILNRKT